MKFIYLKKKHHWQEMQYIFIHTLCQIMLSFSFKDFSNLNTVCVFVVKGTPYHPNEYQDYYFTLNIHVITLRVYKIQADPGIFA